MNHGSISVLSYLSANRSTDDILGFAFNKDSTNTYAYLMIKSYSTMYIEL